MAPSPTGPWRSFLFAPANHARMAEKVFQAGADAAILDLEDAVAVAGKPAARADAVAALQRPRPCKGFVRVNAAETEWCFGDMEAIRRAVARRHRAAEARKRGDAPDHRLDARPARAQGGA